MLRELRIQNFALVDRLKIEFESGLNIITGETGAGKTILFQALNALLGGKSKRTPVREGAKAAVLQGLFDVSALADFPGAEYAEDGELIIERKIPATGRGRIEANGRLIPVDRLREWSTWLVDFHGQSDKEGLVHASRQRAYLDRYAGLDSELDAYREALRVRREAEAALTREEERIAGLREREDFLRWQVREIDEAELKQGEKEELEEEIRLLQEAEKLRELVYAARQTLHEDDGSAVERIGTIAEKLDRFTDYGDEAATAAEGCRRALAEIDDALRAIDRLEERVDAPASRLEDAIERCEIIIRLERKMRKEIPDILKYRDESHAELETLDRSDEIVKEKRAELTAKTASLSARAETLSKKRGTTAKKLARRIEQGLEDLSFRGARFEIERTRVPDAAGEVVIDGQPYRADRDGIDRIRFQLSANVGEPIRDLKNVASGGELSRIMLALKRVLADSSPVPTVLFDEIDAGVGGDVGEKIGLALRDVAETRQVLCITHLPSIAGMARRHFHVGKEVDKGRTLIRLSILENGDRVGELVRMLGGGGKKASVAHAEEILRAAGQTV